MTELTGLIQPQGFPGLPEGWSTSWETYPDADGELQLFAMTLKNDRPAPGAGQRALVICHGLGEHGGRYLHFPHYLRQSIDVVFCPDHRGHGRSEGLRGHVDSFGLFADDFALAVRRLDERLRGEHGASEIHVLGHSLGSLILLQALYAHPGLPVRSACVSSPLLALKVRVPLAKRAASGVLSRVWGDLQLSNEIDPALLSHDRAVAAAYAKDRLVHPKITPRLFEEMRAAMAAVKGEKRELAFPLLFVVPMDDRIVDPEAALEFYRSLGIRDKLLKTYPGFYHESFNELGKERVFEDLEQWIRQHAGGS